MTTENNWPSPVAAKKLTMADIEANIASEHFFTAADGIHGTHEVPGGPDAWTVPAGLKQLTFCVLILRNGTKVVGLNHGSIDPAQHSEPQGRYEARANAVEKVWELMGYELRSQLMAAEHAAVPQTDAPCTFPSCGCAGPATCTR